MTNLIVGLICLGLGAWGVTAWWEDFGAVLRGLIPMGLLLGGLAAVGTGMQSGVASGPEDGQGNPATPGNDIADTVVERN